MKSELEENSETRRTVVRSRRLRKSTGKDSRREEKDKQVRATGVGRGLLKGTI